MNQPSRGSLTPRSEEHMLGHGFYNKHSHEQGKANAYGLPLIPEALGKIDLDQTGGEFRIADYGSAQGENSPKPTRETRALPRAGALQRLQIFQQFLSVFFRQLRAVRMTLIAVAHFVLRRKKMWLPQSFMGFGFLQSSARRVSLAEKNKHRRAR